MRFRFLLPLFSAAIALAVPVQTGDGNRRDAVIEAFRHSWEGYRAYAWGYDELLSVSNKGGNSRNGWGASIADALGTAVLMGLDDVVEQALGHLAEVDFTTAKGDVDLFETTIRYLGGMISGYDLLKGPYSGMVSRDKQHLVDALLTQATILADRLSFAFNTPTGIPYNNLNFLLNSSPNTHNGVATVGTLVLEWTRLSDLTGNRTYAALAQRAEEYLLHPKPAMGEPFPGLLGTNLYIDTGDFASSYGGWSAGTDSFYEYLLKMWIYSPSRFGRYKERWITAVESTLKYLIQTPKPGVTFVAEYWNSTTLSLAEGHLTCFIGGNLILGGTLLGRRDFKDTGLELTKGCRHAYVSTPSGIAPERWAWDPENVGQDDMTFFKTAGFYPTSNGYYLRPEVIESYYHGWKLTGDPMYREWAWDAFVAINATTRTESGYSSIENVMAKDGGTKIDFQESFWFAEVLKYLYLIFSGDDVEVGVGVQGGRNQWVFNTEAHPIRVAQK
ncbi:glycoside hydrolase [Trichophaea hybrida]|nr:glycoside hydrolase [Trichophaea hybrida]